MRPLFCFLSVFVCFFAFSFPYRGETQRSFFKYEKKQKAFKNRQENFLKMRLKKIQGLREQTDFQKQEAFFKYERKNERLENYRKQAFSFYKEKHRRYKKKERVYFTSKIKNIKKIQETDKISSPPFPLSFKKVRSRF